MRVVAWLYSGSNILNFDALLVWPLCQVKPMLMGKNFSAKSGAQCFLYYILINSQVLGKTIQNIVKNEIPNYLLDITLIPLVLLIAIDIIIVVMITSA